MAKNERISKQYDPLNARESTAILDIGRKPSLFLLVLLFCLGATALFSLFRQDNHSWFSNGFQMKAFNQYNCHSLSDQGCERIIWRTHKFGTILLGDLFQDLRQSTSVPRIFTRPTPKSDEYALPTRIDYRHVLVTRNWFHAIVSGYLYHKAGYECTIEPRGSSVYHSQHYDMEADYHNKYWDTQHLLYHKRYNIPFPSRNNRSLCQYLQEESEETGILVTMDIALSRWYKGLIPYHEKADARTLFLCYEDLVDAFQQEELFYRILQHLFPGIDNVHETFQMPRYMKNMLVQQQANHSVYTGGHASTHNVEVQTRLENLVKRFDQELFHDTIAESNAVFSCGNG